MFHCALKYLIIGYNSEIIVSGMYGIKCSMCTELYHHLVPFHQVHCEIDSRGSNSILPLYSWCSEWSLAPLMIGGNYSYKCNTSTKKCSTHSDLETSFRPVRRLELTKPLTYLHVFCQYSNMQVVLTCAIHDYNTHVTCMFRQTFMSELVTCMLHAKVFYMHLSRSSSHMIHTWSKFLSFSTSPIQNTLATIHLSWNFYNKECVSLIGASMNL